MLRTRGPRFFEEGTDYAAFPLVDIFENEAMVRVAKERDGYE